ncbi:MAG TPA: hypothetical protein VMU09_01430, partial [Acidimicrobiales bacterium]|nr:hypothetical protein [Acidimicrobiales bacterium]
MDERDEHESEGAPTEHVTERVRIIGAEPVGDVQPTTDVAWGTAAPAERADAALHYLGFGEDDADVTEPTIAVESPGEEEPPTGPEAVVPDLPHWTEPATGQVPAVLDRRGDDEDALAADAGPAWREHRHEWEDAAFDPALLADDETRVGALDDAAPPEHHQWELRDLDDDAGAGAEPDDAETLDEPGPGRGRWSMPDVPEPSAADTPDERLPAAPAGPVRVGAAAGSAAAIASAGDVTGVPGVAGVAEGVPAARPAPQRAGAGPRSRQRPPARREDGGARGGPPPTGRRNVPVAIATGVGVAVVALVCFAAGTVATVTLATVVVTLAAAESFAALRRAGARPATLL